MSKNKEYKVGQIVYVIPSKQATLVPVCIVEKRTFETVNGFKLQHLFKSIDQDEKLKILESISGQFFTSLNEAKEVMQRNAAKTIDELIVKVQNVAKQAFPNSIDFQQSHQPEKIQAAFDDLSESFIDAKNLEQDVIEYDGPIVDVLTQNGTVKVKLKVTEQ